MERVPKLKIENQEVGRQEKVVELGSRTLRSELTNFEIPAKRAGAFALMTILAMGFAGADKAEARTRYGPTPGQQVRREVAGQINRGVGEAMVGVDQAHYGKIIEVGEERSVKLTVLNDALSAGKITRREHRLARERIEKDYRGKVSKIRLRQKIFQGIHSGVRVW